MNLFSDLRKEGKNANELSNAANIVDGTGSDLGSVLGKKSKRKEN
jgi:hypothetical protein